MTGIIRIDHVAITADDLVATYTFYNELFGAEVVAEHVVEGKLLVRQIALGGAVLSIHQRGNNVKLVAKRPTPGAADICFRWAGTIGEALELLKSKHIAVLEGPTPRRTADLTPGESIFFRDPDGNLLELMAASRR